MFVPDLLTDSGIRSAGAISVLDQMALYDGDHTYKGKPLFRAAISMFSLPRGHQVIDYLLEHLQ